MNAKELKAVDALRRRRKACLDQLSTTSKGDASRNLNTVRAGRTFERPRQNNILEMVSRKLITSACTFKVNMIKPNQPVEIVADCPGKRTLQLPVKWYLDLHRTALSKL